MKVVVFINCAVMTVVSIFGPGAIARELQMSTLSSVHRSVDGKILISASCSSVEDRIKEIRQWTKAETKTDCPNPVQVTSSEGICTFDITECVPEHVKKYHGLTGTKVGPNCWNTALVMANILPFMRETSPEEWRFYLSSPLCKEVPKGEPLQAGDIGSLEGRAPDRNFQIHGFIHVSDSLVYAKDGMGARSPFALQSYNRMNKLYPMKSMSGECQTDCAPESLERFFDFKVRASIPNYLKTTEVCQDKISPKRAEVEAACFKLTEFLAKNREKCEKQCAPPEPYYYRCESFENYFSKLSKSSQKNYEKFEEMAYKIECSLQPVFLSGTVLTVEAKQNISDAYGAILKYLDQELERSPITEENKFLLTRLALRVQATLYPMEFITNNKIQHLLKPYKQ